MYNSVSRLSGVKCFVHESPLSVPMKPPLGSQSKTGRSCLCGALEVV